MVNLARQPAAYLEVLRHARWRAHPPWERTRARAQRLSAEQPQARQEASEGRGDLELTKIANTVRTPDGPEWQSEYVLTPSRRKCTGVHQALVRYLSA